MAMAWIWTGMVALSVFYGLLHGTIGAVGSAAMEGAAAAVELCLSMAGIMCLWSGVMSVMKASGLMEGLSRLFRPVLTRLLPQACRDPDALAALSGNVSANLLGLGNAATPAGIEAARRLSAQGETGLRALAMLLALNNSSLQLIPSTVMALRAAAGAANPADIWGPTLLSSGAATAVAALLMFLLNRRGERT